MRDKGGLLAMRAGLFAGESWARAAEAVVREVTDRLTAAEARETTLELRLAATAAALQASETHAAALAAQVSAADSQITAADSKLAALHASTSWRLTRPLRSVAYRSRHWPGRLRLVLMSIRRAVPLPDLTEPLATRAVGVFVEFEPVGRMAPGVGQETYVGPGTYRVRDSAALMVARAEAALRRS